MTSKDPLMSEASKLEGNPNYAVWSFKLKNLMNRDEMWKVVEPPPGTVAPTNPVDVAALQELKNRALSMIALSVKDNVIPHIASITEPDQCWLVLKNLYASGTNSRKLMLKRRLANLRMEEGSSMPEFLQAVKELLNEFACIGETISDPDIVEHVLMALPENYLGLVDTVMYRSTLPSFNDLTVLLFQDDLRREIRSNRRSDHEALLVRSAGKKHPGERKTNPRGDSSRSKNKKSETGECHFCGSKDHWMRDCPVLANEVKNRKAKRQEKASANLVETLSGDDDDFVETETDLAVNFTELNLVNSNEGSEKGDWFIDSGASKHVTGLKNLLSELEEGCRSKISTAGGEKLSVAGKGKVEFPTSSGAIKFDDVLYVPGVTKNLLSVGSITDGRERPKILFNSGNFWILRNFPIPKAHQIMAAGKRDRRNGLYRFRPLRFSVNHVDHSKSSLSSPSSSPQIFERMISSTLLWHSRFGHPSYKALAYMHAQSKATGLPTLSSTAPVCTACCYGKQTRTPKPWKITRRHGSSNLPIATRATEPLELLHSDICGPLSSKSLSGSRYLLTITDDFSRYTWVYFLKQKSETLERFKAFKNMIELQSGHRIKAIRSDNGGEYISRDFIRFCENAGILRQLTQTYTPHQNGVSERKNRTLLEKARCMAFASHIPPHLWTEAVATANYLANRTSTTANNGTTPFERLTGSVPSVAHLRIFGCRSYVLNTSPERKKWAPRAMECIFLGYDTTSKGFRNYHRSTRKIIISKDVRFDELTFPCAPPAHDSSASGQLAQPDWITAIDQADLRPNSGTPSAFQVTPPAHSSPSSSLVLP